MENAFKPYEEPVVLHDIEARPDERARKEWAERFQKARELFQQQAIRASRPEDEAAADCR